MLQAYKVALVRMEIRRTISSGSPTCRTPYQALIGLCWSLWHAVCMQLRLSKINSEEPQSLFLFLHCSALLSYALTSCILVQVVESQLWVPAGLGAVPNLGLSQQSTSACIKMSCKWRGTSLCPSSLLTCDFIVIRKENWDALNPNLILFSHLNRVCIIWSIRMDSVRRREKCVCMCVRVSVFVCGYCVGFCLVSLPLQKLLGE